MVGAVSPRFLSLGNFQDVAQTATILMLLAAGAAVPVITRNPDLSIASTLGLSAFISADLMRQYPDLAVPFAFAVALAVGLGLGLINGALVAWGNVPSIVVTLGTLYIYRGIVFVLAGGGRQVNAGEVPASLTALFSATVIEVPLPFLLTVVVITILALVLRRTKWGRRFLSRGVERVGRAEDRGAREAHHPHRFCDQRRAGGTRRRHVGLALRGRRLAERARAGAHSLGSCRTRRCRDRRRRRDGRRRSSGRIRPGTYTERADIPRCDALRIGRDLRSVRSSRPSCSGRSPPGAPRGGTAGGILHDDEADRALFQMGPRTCAAPRGRGRSGREPVTIFRRPRESG